jgi:hypothetical protein
VSARLQGRQLGHLRRGAAHAGEVLEGRRHIAVDARLQGVDPLGESAAEDHEADQERPLDQRGERDDAEEDDAPGLHRGA